MISNYLKLAFRNIRKNKIFSFINVFGLAVGFTCCILLSLYISNELSYDRHLKNGSRIFLLGTKFIDKGEVQKAATTSAPLGKLMQQEFPEIETSARVLRLWRDDKTLLQVKENNGTAIRSFYEAKGFLADSGFFNVVHFPFKEGNSGTALTEPNTVVLHEDLAKKIFGEQPALGKLITISSSTNGDMDCKVSGVFEKSANPSHIDASFFLSFKGGRMDAFANDNPSLANNNMFFTYFLLKQGSDVNKLVQKFGSFVNRHLGEELKNMGKDRQYFLTNIADVHLSQMEGSMTPGGNKTSLFILASIAVLTLLIACINFMNLSTASSSKRAGEVGVRKVLGAQKGSLLRQFLGESVLMAFLALVFAFIISYFLFPLFETVAGKSLIIPTQQGLKLVMGFVLLALLTGLLAGTYPAFYLSSFQPIKVLKGKFSNSLSAVTLRKSLVIFQFVISIVLIVASVVIANQMRFLRNKDLGFKKDQQVVIPLRTGTAKGNLQTFKNELAGTTSIQSIGASMTYPGIPHSQDWLMYKQGESMGQSKAVYINMVDQNLLQTLGVKLLAGRLFSEQFPADTLTRFVVNEETVKTYGLGSPQEAIGKWLAFDWDGQQLQFTIIGVVKNFHFKDLHETIQPIAFRMYNTAAFNYIIATVSGNNADQSLSALGTAWKKLNPNEPFEYSFLDQDFQKNYEAESRQASLIRYFTIIAIIISCLGLFGLATFTAEQRTKEIGIRKVLGASVFGVVGLLSKDFLKLVIVALMIASPLAWYAMNKWLQNFAYQTEITWQVFALTAILALGIAFGTISFQSVKAAISNPVKSLRTE